jgi:hypothetical protein
MSEHPTKFGDLLEKFTPPSYLRLRDTGDGKWAIVRVGPYQQFGREIVASGLTRQTAEQMINLSKEK